MKYIKSINLVYTIILFILIIVFLNTRWFQNFNNFVYDSFLYLNKNSGNQNQVVIVKIDDKTINTLGKWPLSRDYYSKLVEKLFKDKAKVVAFDIIFVDPTLKDIDKKFIETLEKHPAVIIDTFSKTPHSEFFREISQSCASGHKLYPMDDDGYYRKQLLLLNKKPSFALAVANLYDPEAFNFNSDKNSVIIRKIKIENPDQSKLINFKYSQDNFAAYSFIDVLDNKIPSEKFKDKIVIITLTANGLYSEYLTPFSKDSITGKVKSGYFHAQVIDSIINNEFIKEYKNDLMLYIFLFLYIYIIIRFSRSFDILKQVLTLLLGLPLIFLTTSFLAFKYFYIWFSPVSLILSTVLSLIVMLLITVFKVSNILDHYIVELSSKTDKQNQSNTSISVDSKIITLKELVKLIESDKDILETVLSSVNNAIILFDDRGKIIYSNDSKYYSENNYLTEILPGINLDEILKESKNQSLFHKKLSINNNHYKFIAKATKNNLYVGVLNDITDMVNINEMKTSILRMLTHEIKSPLASILLYSNLVEEISENNMAKDYMGSITKQVQFLQKLIDNFLELNKLETSELVLNKIEINLKDLIGGIKDSFEIIAQEKKIQLIYNYENNLTQTILADPGYLHIAIKNLVDNALKYSPPETNITIEVSGISKNKIKVSIKDEGFGISQENIEKLFDKFFRIKSGSTANIAGHGLGLSFVKRIIELHGGNITVESELGKGSQFIITLQT